MHKPSYQVWKGILGDFVPPSRKAAFEAHLARLWAAWGSSLEIEQPKRREREDSDFEKEQQAKRKLEVQAQWTEAERAKRREGVDTEKKIAEAACGIAYIERKAALDKKLKAKRSSKE